MMRKILLVEDDPNFRAVLALALEVEGYAVRQAASGRSALELMQNDIPDLIISDLEMSGMDGRALYERTRANRRLAKIPFVILSAFVSPGGDGAVDGLPADRCFSKEIPISQLRRAIQELLDGSAQFSRSLE